MLIWNCILPSVSFFIFFYFFILNFIILSSIRLTASLVVKFFINNIYRCGNVAAILELDEQLNKDFTIFEAAPQVSSSSFFLKKIAFESLETRRDSWYLHAFLVIIGQYLLKSDVHFSVNWLKSMLEPIPHNAGIELAISIVYCCTFFTGKSWCSSKKASTRLLPVKAIWYNVLNLNVTCYISLWF